MAKGRVVEKQLSGDLVSERKRERPQMKTATNIMSGSGRALGRKTNGAPKNRGNTRVASSGTQPKLHIRSILVPVDFSSPSIKALKYAAAHSRR